MVYAKLLIILLISTVLSACGPLALVSAVGTTVNNAAYNAAERDLNNPQPSRKEQAFKVAIANMNLGIEYMRQGKYEEALDKLNRSILAKPDFAPSYNVLGLLYQHLGENENAEAHFQKSLKLDPSDSSTYNNYGLFLCQNDRLEEAEATFLNAANNPFYDNPEIAYTNAGICVFESKPETGEKYFKEALAKNPEFSQALLQMADISYVRREYNLAHQYLERYKNNSSHTPKSLWLGIRVYSELGYKDDVSSYALLLKNKYPDSEEAQAMMEWDF
ncbi:MAG: type IV pilus biogenesis/stability protein PilW [Proteobacteria bacterium]|nr:type IV pilus biogenesis/stability protein PilW [Pseudomonadota bacterium]